MEPSAEVYRRFAQFEAHGSSPTYESWALGVSDDAEVRTLIEQLPRPKWQPNLIFAAARWNGASTTDYPTFRAWLVEHWPAVAASAMERVTQTNEAGRCSALLPQLSQIPGPLALLEVGASAGLCLYPDRYSYRYETSRGTVTIDPGTGPSAVQLTCQVVRDEVRDVELPHELPSVSWRAGIDLAPVDLADPDSLAWLETLVWPEHAARRERLHAAARIALADPPLMVAGDLNDTVARVAGSAPADCTLVIFHSAVLSYLTLEDRERFAHTVQGLDAVWLSNEGAGVLPLIQSAMPEGVDSRGRFVVARDGRPVALAGGHGQSYEQL